MLTDKLEPLPHFNMTEYIRVPILKRGDEYIVYLANSYRKIYTLLTLPLYISSKITIANFLTYTNLPSNNSLDRTSLFMCPTDGGDKDTCWKASENWYIVIIHMKDFIDLQGQRVDSRKKNKNKSKKDIR